MSYQGIGDVKSGAAVYYGLRGYNAAYATGSNPCADLVRASDSATMTMNILSSGAADFVTALAWVGGSSAKVTKWYDQTGNGFHVIQATGSKQPGLTFGTTGLGSGQGSLTSLIANATLLTVGTSPAIATPWTTVAYAMRTAAFTTEQYILHGRDVSVNDHGLAFSGSANTAIMYDGGLSTSGAANDSAWRSLIGVGDSAQVLYVDGVSAGTRTVTATAWTTNGLAVLDNVYSNEPLSGEACELAVYASLAFSSGDASAIYTNQSAYWSNAVPSGTVAVRQKPAPVFFATPFSVV